MGKSGSLQCRCFRFSIDDDDSSATVDELNAFLEKVTVHQVFASATAKGGTTWSVLIFYRVPPPKTIHKRRFEKLREWRNKRAAEEAIEPMDIATNTMLDAIVKSPVKHIEDLLGIQGFDLQRAQRFGEEILRVLGRESHPHDTPSDKPIVLDFGDDPEPIDSKEQEEQEEEDDLHF